VTIHPISLTSNPNHVAYVVNIPKSNTAHQASDKKYYRRFNFETVPMEDYEIKDIINRLSSPELGLVLNTDQTNFDSGVLKFPIILYNKSKRLAKDVKISIQFNDSQNYDFLENNGFTDESHLNLGRKIFSSHSQIRVYNGLNAHIGFFELRLQDKILRINITVTIYSDYMSPSIIPFAVVIQNNMPIYLLNQ
jgi:hypothetical protein